MTDSDQKAPCCQKCGRDITQIAQRGAHLRRTNPKGERFKGECAPSCDGQHGGQDDAVIRAIRGHADD